MEKETKEKIYGHGERGGEGEMYGKSNMEIYITVCKIDSKGEFAVWLRKLKQGLCINPEGGMGREMGGWFKRKGIYVYLWTWNNRLIQNRKRSTSRLYIVTLLI